MPSVRIADRMARIAPFHVMELLARARALEAAGRSIVHMEIGEPDFATPEPVIRAGRDALSAGRTRYTPAAGLSALRSAISDYYRSRYGVAVPAERVLITPGASGALQLVLGVLVGRDQEVLLADPGYPCNRHFVTLFEGLPVGVAVGPESGYQLTAQTCVTHWTARTVAALVASPANPTGTVLDAAALKALIDVVAQRDGRLIVDEIYHGLVYGDELPTALAFSDQIFVINSFSKYFGMTGWRVGWVVAPDGYVSELDKLAQNIFLAASTPAQYAAVAAFSPEAIAIAEQRRREFARRRDFLLPALRELGFDVPVAPTGAFYIYARCDRLCDDSYRFCLDLLEQAGVAVTPGLDFGRVGAAQHVRFAYTTSLEQLQEGVERIARFLRRT